MADTREVRTFATEVKFLLEPAQAARVRQWARLHLQADPHGSGPHHDEYVISSVYFDTADHDVFHRRGSFGRSKYRIRRYGRDEVVYLERKLREPTILAKRRTMAPLVALEQLESGAFSPSWSGRWFHARLAARRLRPVCQVSYRRTARVAAGDGELVRLTLDDALVAQPATGMRFEDEAGVAAIDGRQILELKFRHHTPVVFKRLVEEFALTPAPASKYRLGMVAIGQAPAAVPATSQVGGDLAAADAAHG